MAFLQVDYKSKQLGRKAHFNVFLPMDVDPAKTGAPFRTLYLLHGIYGNSTSWVTSSCIQRYADDRNLCVVMPDGENGFYLDHPDYMNNFSRWIGEELVEATRAMLPLSPQREDTWIGGFSMGGYGALRTGLKYADTFGGIIAFSSALLLESLQNRTGTAGPMNEPYARAMFGDLDHLVGTDLDPLQLARERVQSGKDFPRLYLSCGEQDFLLADNEKFHQALMDLGVEHTWRTTPGGHTWDFWEQEIRHVVLEWMPEERAQTAMNPDQHTLDF
ncbi:MAG: acetylesterase [Clostridia bacterium]|nr:acetylesterase [Clostridia bacterium]